VAGSDRMIDSPVGSAELARMHRAAAVVAECRRSFAASGTGILGAMLAGEAPLADWRHYPAGEVYDPHSHGQYFYHIHPEAGRSAGEHGHFHTFLRADGMPSRMAPLVLPETAVAAMPPSPPQAPPQKHGGSDEVCHLVAITLDPSGEPIRLFTTNRWVTGETWYRADDVIGMLDSFAIGAVGPSTILNRWIVAMIALFHPQIAALLRRRDETVMAWRRRRRTNVFEDTRLEITSSLDIELDAQLALVERLGPETGAGSSAWASPLPPMADGWGEGHAG
jgi:hypothetical protein